MSASQLLLVGDADYADCSKGMLYAQAGVGLGLELCCIQTVNVASHIAPCCITLHALNDTIAMTATHT